MVPFLLAGPYCVPQHNIQAVAEGTHFTIGKVIATCLVQGGQPPVCFSSAVANFLVYIEVRAKPCLDDIPNLHVREQLAKVIYEPGHCYEKVGYHSFIFSLHIQLFLPWDFLGSLTDIPQYVQESCG